MMTFTSDKFEAAYNRSDSKERGKQQRKERNARQKNMGGRR